MAAKPEAPAAETPAAAPAAVPAPAKKGGIGALLPLIAALVVAPALSWAVAEFVLFPKFEKKLAALSAKPAGAEGTAAGAEEPPPAEAEPAPEEKGGEGEGAKPTGEAKMYEFTNVVVNLSGTQGTRYLKVSFEVRGNDANLRALFEKNKPRLVDTTLTLLSALTLADLEEPGSKNLIREKLLSSYNQILGRKVADQLYFSDFVVQ